MEGNLKEQLKSCNQVCKDLSNLLESENEALQQRNIKVVEENTKVKRQLTIKLEKFVNLVKNNIQIIQSNQEYRRDLGIFARSIEEYKKLVERNAMLLKAAYTATSSLISGIQKRMNKTTVKTYNAYGTVQEQQVQTGSLLNYSV